MAVTTDEFWSVDGLVLNTLAYNITTRTGRESLPDLRGDRTSEVAFRPGGIGHASHPESRLLTFSMWVAGCDEDGQVPESHTQLAEYNANYRRLVRAFYQTREPLLIVKRLTLPTETLVLSADAWYASGLSPDMTGNTRSEFEVSVVLPDVWFFGTPTDFEGLTVATADGEVAVDVPGDVETYHVSVQLVGPLTSPRFYNVTTDTWVEYGGNIADGDTVTLDVPNFRATNLAGSSVIGFVTHSGDTLWLRMLPGSNTIKLEAVDGAGHAIVTVTPAYV